MELVGLVCDGENNLRAEGTPGEPGASMERAQPGLSAAMDSAAQTADLGLQLGGRSPRASWGAVGVAGSSPEKALYLRGPGPAGSQGVPPEQVN